MSEPQDPENSTRRLPTVEPAPAGGVIEMDQSASGSTYEPAPAPDHKGGRAGRFWSRRGIPAAVVALIVLGGTGILLYDVAAVRADHPAMQWRRSAADDLASRHLDDVWVLAGSALAAALGLWLLLLALTPGLRALLPMRREHPGVRAGLDRNAAALVLRDRAVEVAGVQAVRVRMSRHKATVRALSHFRELDDVRADLDTVLSTAVSELGLARPPGLSVHVSRPAKKG
ncbi:MULTISPECIES: DUF6286 domain-containing protein [unclassified Streptomyces]|uniref:DUF6286 domain-containing protein n=1 Tax=unclassified Streptomyces TaxID=2593676 RepID=UPI000938C5B9|nr:DUF6286 domain-containing protein [Streptomyces sp. CB02058]OKI96599.1 hypothetical protein AMK10_13435 [Streptomyces sp. CB02058]